MSIATGGKDKYVTLLSLIKRESPSLYEVIDSLALDGVFRNRNFQNTFLFPSKDLIKKLVKLVDDDEDETAIENIRSLILPRHTTKGDFKKGAEIFTLNNGSKILADPEEVGKNLNAKEYKKTVHGKPINNGVSFVIYQYDGKDFPTIKDSAKERGSSTRVGSGGTNENFTHVNSQHEADRCNKIREIRKHLKVEGNAADTLRNYYQAVAILLNKLEEDAEVYKRAKFYMSTNPVLSFEFLTMHGNEECSIVDIKHLEALGDEHNPTKNLGLVVDHDEIINKALTHEYKFNDKLYAEFNKANRETLKRQELDLSLMSRIIKVYQNVGPEMLKAGLIDEQLHKNVNVKILMDELRFTYDSCVSDWDSMDDMLTALASIRWEKPQSAHVLTNTTLYKTCSTKTYGSESVKSGPFAFIESVYFLYMPFTADTIARITSARGGNKVAGGKFLRFTGGAASKKQTDTSISLKTMISVMSKSQREALKALL